MHFSGQSGGFFTWDNKNITVNGSVTLSNSAVNMGNGTWTVGGDFNYQNVTTFNSNSSTLVMAGASATLTFKAGIWLNNLTINSGANVTATSTPGDNIGSGGNLKVYGTLAISGTRTYLTGPVYVYSGLISDCFSFSC